MVVGVAGLCVELVFSGVAWADLWRVNKEPNLEKRSKLALENAHQALKAARQAYDGGDLDTTRALLLEVEQSVHLAEESLKKTGKNPRRSPKHFKRAEIDTRELLRRIDSFRDYVSFADRSMLDTVKTKIQLARQSSHGNHGGQTKIKATSLQIGLLFGKPP